MSFPASSRLGRSDRLGVSRVDLARRVVIARRSCFSKTECRSAVMARGDRRTPPKRPSCIRGGGTSRPWRVTVRQVRSLTSLAMVLVLASCSSSSDADLSPTTTSLAPQRVAVRWSAIELSPDRRTITATTYYPRNTGCAKKPDGIDVTIEGGTARVAVWMTQPGPGPWTCTAECAPVTQSATLDQALSADVATITPVDSAVAGCDTPG
jgi:hypothetical protein